ncbi:hypothetical protein BC833DRAFT_576247 [Globomyces pollinis-pini]|nr:hypothetical protein BC833DRAFT_576247 [Globomyces pollinis-pini]KAJ3000382.1 hypothetical protein HDV02_005742 [Globomyces sp. JEL0801]
MVIKMEDYTGKWQENRYLSDSMEPILDLQEIPWLIKQAINAFAPVYTITQNDQRVIVSLTLGVTKNEIYEFDDIERISQPPFGPPLSVKCWVNEGHLVVEQKSEVHGFQFRAKWSVSDGKQLRHIILTMKDGTQTEINLVLDRIE